ncbi:MAG: protease complex subunit PrcB family protein [Hungatella sp.]
MKTILLVVMILWVIVVRALSGCSIEKESQDKVKDLEFTVIGENEIPEELQKMILDKQVQPFKLTFSDDQNLYIVVGYGVQESGGYSISVSDLYLTENSIVIDTELQGPEKGTAAFAASYPYIVVKTAYMEQPVIFQ